MKEPIITNKIVADKSYTIDDYTKQILEPMTRRFAETALYEQLMRKNALADMLAMGYITPTKWQRFKYRMQDIGQCFKDIWTIVSGGDIHKDCGY